MKEDAQACGSHENISLKLDHYDDIFSSFDPRPYSERALSVDFLDEARRASIDKPSGEIELRLLVPARLRKLDVEGVIQARLRSHFDRHVKKLRRRYGGIVRNGALFVAAGILMMFLATFMLFGYSQTSFLMHFLLIIFEPAGWFFFWEGLDQIVFQTKRLSPDLDFYTKMAKSDIVFLSCK